jgi:predicted nucleic acid-binding protein
LALVDEVPRGANIAVDTSAVIYFVELNPDYHPLVRPVFERIELGTLRGHASVISLIEVLVRPLAQGDSALADRYRRLLRTSRNVELHSGTEAIAERAATVRSSRNRQVADAIVAATARESGSSHLTTNDPVFRRVDDLNVLVVSDFVTP